MALSKNDFYGYMYRFSMTFSQNDFYGYMYWLVGQGYDAYLHGRTNDNGNGFIFDLFIPRLVCNEDPILKVFYDHAESVSFENRETGEKFRYQLNREDNSYKLAYSNQ